MKHTLSYESFWTVAEIIEKLSGLSPDIPVIIATEGDEEQDMLFWFDPCEDTDGNKALFIRVDMSEVEGD